MIRTIKSELEKIATEYRAGASVKEINRSHFMCESSVRRRLKEEGVMMRSARIHWICSKQPGCK
jgi:hypothetical protein